MVFYAVFAGAPIIIVGFLGVEIQKRIPRVYSFSDYVQRVSNSSSQEGFEDYVICKSLHVCLLLSCRSVVLQNSREGKREADSSV